MEMISISLHIRKRNKDGELIQREFFERIVAYAETNIASLVLSSDGEVQGKTTRYKAREYTLGVPTEVIVIETLARRDKYKKVLTRVEKTAKFVSHALKTQCVIVQRAVDVSYIEVEG